MEALIFFLRNEASCSTMLFDEDSKGFLFLLGAELISGGCCIAVDSVFSSL